jgi:hypothetical protein
MSEVNPFTLKLSYEPSNGEELPRGFYLTRGAEYMIKNGAGRDNFHFLLHHIS